MVASSDNVSMSRNNLELVHRKILIVKLGFAENSSSFQLNPDCPFVVEKYQCIIIFATIRTFRFIGDDRDLCDTSTVSFIVVG